MSIIAFSISGGFEFATSDVANLRDTVGIELRESKLELCFDIHYSSFNPQSLPRHATTQVVDLFFPFTAGCPPFNLDNAPFFRVIRVVCIIDGFALQSQTVFLQAAVGLVWDGHFNIFAMKSRSQI